MPVDLSQHDSPNLKAMNEAFNKRLGSFLRGNQPYWNAKLGLSSGTLSNLEQGLSFMATLGHSGLEAGCVSLQSQTYQTLSAAGPGDWVVEKVRVGTGAFGHSAVAVYPKGGNMAEGYVFDAWISQAPLVYTFDEWKGHFDVMSLMGSPRAQ